MEIACIYFEILQLRAKIQTAMMSCSRFTWITNSNFHRRVWTANLSHTKSLPNPPGHKAERIAAQTLLRSLEFVIQINPEHDTIAACIYSFQSRARAFHLFHMKAAIFYMDSFTSVYFHYFSLIYLLRGKEDSDLNFGFHCSI